MVGILNTGDLFIWNKDTDVLKYIEGLKEFGFKLGYHSSQIYINDDATKLVLITSRNKIYVFESKSIPNLTTVTGRTCCLMNKQQQGQDESNNSNNINGTWSSIIVPKDIVSIEDSKEMKLNGKFYINKNTTQMFTCCFTFIYESKPVITLMKLKWLNNGELISLKQNRFECLWKTFKPLNDKNNDYQALNTHDSLILELSNNTQLVAFAINQKYSNKTCLQIISSDTGALFNVNLRNFGLKLDSKGRHYWIQELKWSYDDLYLIGITKHGSIFITSRLGHPLLIQSQSQDMNLGPALFITLHPFIIIKNNKKQDNKLKEDDESINSLLSTNDDSLLKQHYSLNTHPTLNIFACTDGYLVTILKFDSRFTNENSLLNELALTSTNLVKSLLPLNEFNKKYNKKQTYLSSIESNEQPLKIPNWDLTMTTKQQQQLQQEATDDSGVEYEMNNKIADGKIIFSYIPQIMPISFEKLDNYSLINRLDILYELIQIKWNLILTTSNKNNNNDKIADLIIKLFSDYTKLIIKLDNDKLNEINEFKLMIGNKDEFTSSDDFDRKCDEFKLKYTIASFFNLLTALFFKQSTNNTIKLSFKHSSKLLNQFILNLLKNEQYFHHLNLYSLLKILYSLVKTCDNLIKNNINRSKDFIYLFNELNLFKIDKNSIELNENLNNNTNQKAQLIAPNELINRKCWKILLNFTNKYKKTILFTKQNRANELNELNKFIIIIENNLLINDTSIKIDNKKQHVTKIDNSYELYLNGKLNEALKLWLIDLNDCLSKNTKKCLFKANRLSHQILYACLLACKLNELVYFLNSIQTNINLNINTFNYFELMTNINKCPVAILNVLKSFGRFMANYFMNRQPLVIPKKPYPIPSLLSNEIQKYEDTYELLNETITQTINKDKKLAKVFTIEKTMELLIVTGCYDEALYLAFKLNDWKSCFLLSTIITNNKLASKLPEYLQPYNLINKQIVNLIDTSSNYELFTKERIQKQNSMLSQLLLCCVLTRIDILDKLFKGLLEKLVRLVVDLPILVPNTFYLPAPPYFNIQNINEFNENNNNDECKLRCKIANLIKCIIQLLVASNLHVALIKWYLEELKNVSIQMKISYGLINTFELSNLLNELLKLIRYQKISYISNDVLLLFRDFCALLFYLNVRDKYSHLLRIVSSSTNKTNENKLNTIDNNCLLLIDYGILLISFDSFIKQEDKLMICDVIISTISRVSDLEDVYSLNLYYKLAICINKVDITQSEDLIFKYETLTNKWKLFKTSFNSTLFDIYNQQLKINEASNETINKLYGCNENILSDYLNGFNYKIRKVGSYFYERSNLCVNFLELLFEIGFDSWDNLVKQVNTVPLLISFYDQLKEHYLPNDYPDHSNFIKIRKLPIYKSVHKKIDEFLDSDDFKESNLLQNGLFSNSLNDNDSVLVLNRSISLNDLKETNTLDSLSSKKLKRSVSFNKLNESNDDINDENDLVNDETKVLDYGQKYGNLMQLAIWLIKWSQSFNYYLINDKKSNAATKIRSINANMLIACVFIADQFKSIKSYKQEAPKVANRTKFNNDLISDDLTEITQTMAYDYNQQQKKYIKEREEEEEEMIDDLEEEDEEASSTLDISSIDQDDIIPFNYTTPLHDTKLTESPEWTITKTPSPIKTNRQDDNSTHLTRISPIKFEQIQQSSPFKKPTHVNEQVNQVSFNNKPIESTLQINEIIKQELKNIVKLQHDTVMNFLNGNSIANNQFQASPFGDSSLFNQLKLIRESNKQSEFIIETKVKANPSQNNNLPFTELLQTTQTNNFKSKSRSPSPRKNYFMKKFDYNIKNTNENKSIQIPLLGMNNNNNQFNSRNDNKSSIKLVNLQEKNEPLGQKSFLPFIERGLEVKQNKNNLNNNWKSNFKLLKIDRNEHKNPEYIYHNEIPKDSNYKPVKLLSINKNQQAKDNDIVRRDEFVEKKEEIEEDPVKDDKKDDVIDKVLLYDGGYVIKPNSFPQVSEIDYDKIDLNSAEAHFISTKHLREQTNNRPLKKEVYTMTDNQANTLTSNANNLMPDILFKLKFDPLKKGRENTQNDNQTKDFVNVVDIKSQDVENILKIIEDEQNKRNEQHKIKPSILKQEKQIIIEKQEENEEDDTETKPKIDKLTEQLLIANDDLIIDDYNKLHENIMESSARIKSKKHIMDEFNLIDSKIKMMNEMAFDMQNDFNNYNKIVDTIENNNRQLIEQTNKIPSVISILNDIKQKEEKEELLNTNLKMYTPKEASDKMNDFRSSLNKSQPLTKKIVTIDDKTPMISEFEHVSIETSLSDLRDSEEDKVKKLLNLDSSVASNVILNLCDDDELMANHVNESKTSKLSPNKRTLTSTNTRQRSPSPGLNVTYKVPTSPIVIREKEKALKREMMKNNFMEARANEAKYLLDDIISETTKMTPRLRSTSREREQAFKENDERKQTTSLMTKTIEQLTQKEKQKWQQELAMYENYTIKDNESINESKQIKTIKSFKEFVHLQEPDKLNHRPLNKAQTYSEILQRHQNKTIKIDNNNSRSKVYGTKRVPGVFKPYSKPADQRKVKTYSERLKELKPPKSIHVDRPINKPKVSQNKSSKRNNSTFTINNSKKPQKKTTKLTAPIISPLIRDTQNLDAFDDELSPWSIDDNIKNILYGNDKPTSKAAISSKTQIKKANLISNRDQDQDTLADIDGYYQFIDDTNENYDIDQLINDNDLTTISGNSIKTDDIKNLISLSTESGPSYIDWDQIDNLTNKFSKKK